jgi:hypothetical protein
MDAGMGLRAGCVDFFYAGVRVRGAEEFAMHHAGEGNVVGVAGLASDSGAGIHAATRFADYAEIFGVMGGFLRGCLGGISGCGGWRIFLVGHVSLRALRGGLPLFGDFEDGGFHGFEDLKIAGAAAEIAG